jgi:TPR repeat protein
LVPQDSAAISMESVTEQTPNCSKIEQTAYENLQKAANLKAFRALRQLGKIHLNGTPWRARDTKLALHYLRLAAWRNCFADEQKEIFQMLALLFGQQFQLKDKGKEHDSKGLYEVEADFSEVSASNHPKRKYSAELCLLKGSAFAVGNGVEENHAESTKWFGHALRTDISEAGEFVTEAMKTVEEGIWQRYLENAKRAVKGKGPLVGRTGRKKVSFVLPILTE